MKKHSRFTQWLAFGLLMLWGVGSFIVLASDEAPERPLSIEAYLLIKAAAMLSFCLCVRAGFWLNSKGLMPDTDEDGDSVFF